MSRRATGSKVVREMMGAQEEGRLNGAAESGTFGAAIAGFAIDQAFAEIWTRPGLD